MIRRSGSRRATSLFSAARTTPGSIGDPSPRGSPSSSSTPRRSGSAIPSRVGLRYAESVHASSFTEDAMLKVVAFVLGPLLILAWQSPSAAEAIEMGGLRGAVRDENGKPVTGASIKIRNVERGITVTVFSRGGNYGAPELFPGRSEVSAGMGGHAESAKAAVEIAPGKKTLLNLALKRSAPILTPADWIAHLPDDRDGVKQLIINRCGNCHGPVNFVSRRFDRLGEQKVVLDMGRIEIGRASCRERV